MLHRVLEPPGLITTKEYRYSHVSIALCITNALSDYRLTTAWHSVHLSLVSWSGGRPFFMSSTPTWVELTNDARTHKISPGSDLQHNVQHEYRKFTANLSMCGSLRLAPINYWFIYSEWMWLVCFQYCYSLSAMMLLVCAESVTDKCIFVEAFQLQRRYSPPVKMEVQKLLGNGKLCYFPCDWHYKLLHKIYCSYSRVCTTKWFLRYNKVHIVIVMKLSIAIFVGPNIYIQIYGFSQTVEYMGIWTGFITATHT